MKLTGLGKFVILILIVGLAVGGFRWWTKSNGLPKLPGLKIGTSGAGTSGGGTTGQGTGGGTTSSGDVSSTGEVSLQLITSPTTRGWLQDQNRAFQREVHRPVQSHDALYRDARSDARHSR